MTPISGTLRDGALIKHRPSYYTPTQVHQYLTRVGWRESDCSTQIIVDGLFHVNLENLETLVRRHYLTFSLENSLMHYSEAHEIDISPGGVFKRLVVDRSGGTYCYGHNGLMLGVLRALGYRAYAGAARMNSVFHLDTAPSYSAYGHMILFVQLGTEVSDAADSNGGRAQTWLVDVAPGPQSPLLPMPLSNDPDNIIANATLEEENRLTRAPHPESSLESSMASKMHHSDLGTAGVPNARNDTSDTHAMWQLEYRVRGDSPSPAFKPVYQFTEEEFFPPEFAAMHFTKMHKPHDDVFWDDVVAVRYVLAESMGDEDDNGLTRRTLREGGVSRVIEQPLVRVSMFRGVIRWRIGGRVLRMLELKSEDERVDALGKFFGTVVAREDIKYILGKPAAL